MRLLYFLLFAHKRRWLRPSHLEFAPRLYSTRKISTSHTGPVTIRYRVIGITRFCSNAKSSDSSLIDESVRLLRSWAPMIRK